MYTLPKSNYLKRSLLVNDRGQVYAMGADPLTHGERIKQELQALGVSAYALWRAESRFLPHIIHPSEHIGGVVYGRLDDSFAMLVATDRRVIFLDKHPLFVNEDEITYFVVSGVTYNRAGIGATVTLHTRIRDYTFQTLNKHCAEGFVRYIEARCLEHKSEKEKSNDFITKNWAV
jgi:hypothetical protein